MPKNDEKIIEIKLEESCLYGKEIYGSILLRTQ